MFSHCRHTVMYGWQCEHDRVCACVCVCMALPPWRHPLTQADILPLIYARNFHREILRLRTLKCFDSLLFIVNNKDKIFNQLNIL